MHFPKIRTAVACAFAAVSFTISASAQTTQSLLEREKTHLQQVTDRLSKHPELAKNPYVRCEIAIAKRFIDRLHTGAGKGDHAPEWAQLQTDEIKTVLNHTEKTIEQVEQGKLPPTGLGPVPIPTGGPVKIDNGVFLAETTIPGVDDDPKMRPFYFGGYGHFDQIVRDIPNFPELGVTLIQDGRNGPKQGLNQDRTLTAKGLAIKDMLAAATKAKVKVDILTSPHYFPDWAVNEAPDMQNGSAFHNIDHPRQREVIETWLTRVAELAKDQPSLLSYCLSNEPAYGTSGRDSFSAPAWHAFLKDRHKTIENLNKIYEKTYKSFADVPPGGWGEDPITQRHAYDWVCFNDAHFAGWHKWMGDVLRKHDPRALTHAKIMIFFTLDRNQAGAGIDPEQFALATDIAGCDAYAQVGVGVGPLDESTSKEYVYNWQVEEMSYDLLNSFRNQPVFNSENHPMPNATGAYRWPTRHTRAVMWQGGLHHMGASTTWAWEEAEADSLLHSIYFRPAHIWQHSRAFLDLNRLTAEVTAINRAPATVAIVYSPASRYWQNDYSVAMRTCYTALNFLGEKITFVSERQLAEGRVPAVKAIVLPKATHLTDAAAKALAAFSQKGKLIFYGADCASLDEYGRPRVAAQVPKRHAVVPVGAERAVTDAMRAALPQRADGAALVTDKHEPVWGVEWRVVEHEGSHLVPLINLLKEPQTLELTVGHSGDEAVDLLNGERVVLKQITLKPMEPMLLKIAK
jgi:hypothetical protein